MQAWIITAALAGVFVAVGAAIDHLLIRHQKNAWHRKMTAWWMKIYETQLVDIGKLMAKSTLNVLEKVFKWPLLSWQTFFLSVLLSFFATSLAGMIGSYFDKDLAWYITLPLFGAYLLNYPFDILTVAVTIKVLQQLRYSAPVVSLLLVLIDIVVAFILASFCLTALCWGSELTEEYFSDFLKKQRLTFRNPNIIADLKKLENRTKYWIISENKEELLKHGIDLEHAEIEVLETLRDYVFLLSNTPLMLFAKAANKKIDLIARVRVIVKDDTKEAILLLKVRHELNWSGFFMSCTTLIPTAAYMTILVLMLLAKMLLEALRVVSMQLLERITQDDPDYDPDKFKPGTLFGYLFSGVAALSSAIATILKLFSS